MVYQKNNSNKKQRKTLAQKTIITIIILAIITVATSVICSLIFNTEYQIKNKISHLASEYYENHFYSNISKSDGNPAEALERYTDTGLAKVSLRQLVLSNPNVSNDEKDFLYQHCNENSTSVQFFPESPYDKKSYRTEYTYSCKF